MSAEGGTESKKDVAKEGSASDTSTAAVEDTISFEYIKARMEAEEGEPEASDPRPGCELCTPNGDFKGFVCIEGLDRFEQDDIDYKALQNEIRENVMPPLHRAAANADVPSLVSMLESEKYYVDEVDSAQQTPLQHAVWCPDPMRVCGHLLHFGANVNSIDMLGATAFMNAIRADLPMELIQMFMEQPKKRKGKKAQPLNINQQDHEGLSALHIAIFRGRADIVEELLKIEGIDVKLVDKYSRTTWRLASHLKHAKIQNLLLKFIGA